MTVLLIVSDRTSVGKTATAAAIVSEVLAGNGKAAYLKLFPALDRPDPDVTYINEHLLSGDAAQSSGAKRTVDGGPGETIALAESLSAEGKIVVAEGPTLDSFQGEQMTLVDDMVRNLDCKVLFVQGYPTTEVSPAAPPGGALLGEGLVGVIVNMVPPYRLRQLADTLDRNGNGGRPHMLGAIPSDRTMASVTVGEIAQGLKARWVMGEERADVLIEHFLVGGNIMDGGDTYFGRHQNKAVLVRGDRPDIQLACLNTETACLLLSGGFTPNQYVYHEAEQQDVPLLVMEEDTIACAELLDELLSAPPVHHPAKTQRFRELLRAHADMGFLPQLLEGIA